MQPFKSRPLPPPWRRALVGVRLKKDEASARFNPPFSLPSICEVESLEDNSGSKVLQTKYLSV